MNGAMNNMQNGRGAFRRPARVQRPVQPWGDRTISLLLVLAWVLVLVIMVEWISGCTRTGERASAPPPPLQCTTSPLPAPVHAPLAAAALAPSPAPMPARSSAGTVLHRYPLITPLQRIEAQSTAPAPCIDVATYTVTLKARTAVDDAPAPDGTPITVLETHPAVNGVQYGCTTHNGQCSITVQLPCSTEQPPRYGISYRVGADQLPVVTTWTDVHIGN